jgi:hypothetical protein
MTMYNILEIVSISQLEDETPKISYQDFVLLRYRMYLKIRISPLVIE